MQLCPQQDSHCHFDSLRSRRWTALHCPLPPSLPPPPSLEQSCHRLFEAEALDRRALDICTQSLDASHPLLATCANNLGMVLQLQGRCAVLRWREG